MLWVWEALYEREADPSVEACVVLGVDGTPFVDVRAVRAVSGVGALISDFFGVSITCFGLIPLKVDDEGVERVLVAICLRFPASIKGCRMAVWGFMRRSGSHTRHLAMKSTNSSSLHLRACASVREPGLRLRPFEFTTGLGEPFVSARRSDFKTLIRRWWITHQRKAFCVSYGSQSPCQEHQVLPLCKIVVPAHSLQER